MIKVVSFDDFRDTLKFLLKEKYPNLKFDEQSVFSVFLDTITYMAQYLKENVDKQISECFLDSQTESQNIKSILSYFSYRRRYANPAIQLIKLSFSQALLREIRKLMSDTSPLIIKVKKDQTFRQGNIPFRQIEQSYTIQPDMLQNLIQNNMDYQQEIFQVQTTFHSFQENQQNYSFQLDPVPYQKIRLYSNINDYLIPHVDLYILDEDLNKYEQQQQMYYDELFHIIKNEKKIGILLEYDEEENQFFLIVQPFFDQNLPNLNQNKRHYLYVQFYTTLGEGGNVQKNQINEFENQDLIFSFVDRNNNLVEYTFQQLQEINQIIQDDMITCQNPYDVTNGAGVETIDEFIQNQLKFNKTNNRQVTREDFKILSELFLSNAFPQYKFILRFLSRYGWYQNLVEIFLQAKKQDQTLFLTDEKEFSNIQRALEQFLTELQPFTLQILVKKQKIRKFQLQGTIYYDQSKLEQQQSNIQIFSELQDQLNKIAMEGKSELKINDVYSLLIGRTIVYQDLQFLVEENGKWFNRGKAVSLGADEIQDFITQQKMVEYGFLSFVPIIK